MPGRYGSAEGGEHRPVAGLERAVDLLPADLGGAFAAGMTQLEADLGDRVAMDEVDDSAPGFALGFVPEAGASGRDPAPGRDTGHLREHEPGPADCPGAVMHQVPVVRYPILRPILRHGRDDHPVGEPHSRQDERQKHRRPRHRPDTVAGAKPAFIAVDKPGVANLQIGVADPLTAGEQGIGKLRRLEPDVAGDVLEPLHPVASCAPELERLETSLRLIGLEPPADLGCVGHPANQRDRVFHRKLGSGADREVRGMRGIPDQDDVVMVPLAAGHPFEVEPRRSAEVWRVAQQPVPTQVLGEQPGTERDRVFSGTLVEAVGPPGFLAGFDDDGREILTELVGVDLEPAVLGLFEGEGEGGKRLPGPEPDEAAFANVDIRLEHRGEPGPHLAVHTVRGDDQVGVAERRQIVAFRLEVLDDAEPMGPVLENVQEPPPTDAGKAVAPGAERLTPEMNIDVVPVIEARDDRRMGLSIRGLKARHGLVGKDHPPAEGVIRPVALEHLNLRCRDGFLQQDRRIEPGRAAAETHHAFHRADPITTSSRASASPSSSRRAASRHRRRSWAPPGVPAVPRAAAITRSKFRQPRAWVSP